MTSTEPILTFGDDRSAGANTAWTWICSQTWPGWKIRVAHIEPFLGVQQVLKDDAGLEPWNPEDPRTLPESCGAGSLEHVKAAGDARVVLQTCSDSQLLVVGPRGHGVVKSLHIGSTAEWLLRHPPAPMLIAHTPGEVRRILVCVDGSTHSQAAVAALAALPLISGAEVTVLGVADVYLNLDEAVADAKNAMTGAGATVTATIVHTEPSDPRSPVTEAIFTAAEELDADLVVVGTRGLTGLKGMLLGSTARAVAHHLKRSVLMTTAEE